MIRYEPIRIAMNCIMQYEKASIHRTPVNVLNILKQSYWPAVVAKLIRSNSNQFDDAQCAMIA